MIAVIIPNYNGSRFMDAMCRSLRSQTLSSSKYEILFVDNGSTDGSYEYLKKETANEIHWRVMRYTDLQSSYAARNYGARQTSAGILVFTDIDCQPEPDWLSRILHHFNAEDKKLLLSGCVDMFPIEDSFTIYEWYDRLTALNQSRYASAETGATANLSVCRELFNAVEGFLPVVSGGDRDFCQRVMRLPSANFEYAPDVRVRHPARACLSELRGKVERVNSGKGKLAAKQHDILMKWRFALTQMLGLVIQPNQLRLIARTFCNRGLFKIWSWQFAFLAWRIGFYSRVCLLRNFIKYRNDTTETKN